MKTVALFLVVGLTLGACGVDGAPTPPARAANTADLTRL